MVSIPTAGDHCRHRIYIEDIYPLVDGGRFAVKRIVDEPVNVWADIFRDGHAVLAAEYPLAAGRSRCLAPHPYAAAWQ